MIDDAKRKYPRKNGKLIYSRIVYVTFASVFTLDKKKYCKKVKNPIIF